MRLKALFCLFFLFYATPSEALIQGELFNHFSVRPGQRIEGKLTLTNSQPTPLRVKLHLTDYAYNAEGQNFFEPLGDNPRSNGKWISLAQNWVDIPPCGEREVLYAIRVPTELTHKGAYWSMLLVEPQEPLQQATGGNGVNLDVKVRYGYQIITDVGGGEGKLKIEERRIIETEGKRELHVDVANTGDLFLIPAMTLKLYDGKGRHIVDLNGGQQRVLPTNAVRYRLPLSGVSHGNYHAFLLLDGGAEQLFGSRFPLEIAE